MENERASHMKEKATATSNSLVIWDLFVFGGNREFEKTHRNYKNFLKTLRELLSLYVLCCL